MFRKSVQKNRVKRHFLNFFRRKAAFFCYIFFLLYLTQENITDINGCAKTIEFNIELAKAKNDPFLQMVATSTENKKELVELVYQRAINNNPYMSAALKKDFIESFDKYVLDLYGDLFPEQTILNMYAVASSQKVILGDLGDSIDGSYHSSNNTIYIQKAWKTRATFADEYKVIYNKLLAHEQFHAILKKLDFQGGFRQNNDGRGIDEGFTSEIIGDSSYKEERYYAKTLDLIAGHYQTLQQLFTSDFKNLKSEVNKYLSAEEVKQLFNLIDSIYDLGYSEDDKYKLRTAYQQIDQKLTPLLTKYFDNKYGYMPFSNNFKSLLFGERRYNPSDEIKPNLSLPYQQISNTSYEITLSGDKIIVNISLFDNNAEKINEVKYILSEEDLFEFNIDEKIANLSYNYTDGLGYKKERKLW